MDTNNTCFNCFNEVGEGGGACPHCGYPRPRMQNPPHHLRCGSILAGKYVIGRTLGQGGFGITYVGWDLNLDLKVAVKEYYPDGSATREQTMQSTVIPFTGQGEELFIAGREKFISEARTLAKFANEPGVVNVRDYFQANGTAYIVMEYIEGETLAAISTKRGRMPAAEALELLRPVFIALEKVHEAGLLHRDISPDNIMVRSDGSAKLLDFGASRQISAQGERSNTINVKHGYAPEEQYRTRGEQGPWTDIYALCATIYRITTGELPPQVIDRLAGETIKTPNACGCDFTAAQESALMKGLSIKRTDRQQSIKELYSGLYEGAVTSGTWQEPAGTEKEYVWQEPPCTEREYKPNINPMIYAKPKPVNKLRLMAVIGGVAAVLIIAVILITTGGKDDGKDGSSALAGQDDAVAVDNANYTGVIELPDPAIFFGSELSEEQRGGGVAYSLPADGSNVADYMQMLSQRGDYNFVTEGADNGDEVFLFSAEQNGAAAEFYMSTSTGKLIVCGLDSTEMRFSNPEITAYWLNYNGITYDRWLELGSDYGPNGLNYMGTASCNFNEYTTAAVQGNMLYYTDESNGAIYALPLDGGDEVQISPEGEWGYGLNIVGNNLYYFCNMTDGTYNIYMLDVRYTPSEVTLIRENARNTLLIGKWLYFVDTVSLGLYRMDTSTGQESLILSDGYSEGSYAIDDSGIVYVDTSGQICTATFDGYDKQELLEVDFTPYNIHRWGEWIYFYNTNTETLMRYSLFTETLQDVIAAGDIGADEGYYVAYSGKDTYIVPTETGDLYRTSVYDNQPEFLCDLVFYPFTLIHGDSPLIAILDADQTTLYIYYPGEDSVYSMPAHGAAE